MEYQVLPLGEIWKSGMFSVPMEIANKYIKFASEYQLRALLLILSDGGRANSKTVAKALGCTESDADDFLDFWVEEGVLLKDGQAQKTPVQKKEEPPKKEKKTVEAMPVPTLSPRDIIDACRQDKELEELMHTAQEVLGKTLSHTEQELIINMRSYYGLPPEVVLTILQYYISEKSKGKSIGNAYIAAMAKNWSEEGITTLDAADEKLKELESSNRLWGDIVLLSGIRHRNPTVKQREMIKVWGDNFSLEMIALACDAMKENAEKPSLKYVDTVLKNWIKKGIKTPAEVEADNEMHKASKEKSGKIAGAPSFDISDIEKKTLLNDNYDI